MSLTIGVDIGGTKVAGAVVDENGTIKQSARRPSPKDNSDGLLEAVWEVIDELQADYDIEAVGVGSAGWISSDRSTVLHSANLGWTNVPLRDLIAERCNLPIVIENDANVALWAEHRFGAAKAFSHSVLFTVGTGLGGAIITNDVMVRGQHGTAAEIGHTIAVPDGRLCGCKRHGCIEQYTSGRALTLAGQDAAKAHPYDAKILLKLAGGDADAITGNMITEAAGQGDKAALVAFDEIGRYLAMISADMVQLLDPGIILIGGGVVDAGDLLLNPIRHHLSAALGSRRDTPYGLVRAAQLGSKAGVIGAADLARV